MEPMALPILFWLSQFAIWPTFSVMGAHRVFLVGDKATYELDNPRTYIHDIQMRLMSQQATQRKETVLYEYLFISLKTTYRSNAV